MAEAAGMSRTAFAEGFLERMRMTPGKYLAGLRLALAEQAVAAGQVLKRAAQVAGYASPATLSRAMSRKNGGTLLIRSSNFSDVFFSQLNGIKLPFMKTQRSRFKDFFSRTPSAWLSKCKSNPDNAR